MRQSQFFGTTRREAPRDEESNNAILLTRGGYIQKTMAGVYSFLPLGLMVLQKVSDIIREEMNRLPNTHETFMPTLQPRELWEETGRWALYTGEGEVYTVAEDTMMLGPTHEEVATDLFRSHITSYKQLPIGIYQVQTKFRKELRAKSGLLRGREFRMKDLYSFHLTEEDFRQYYEAAASAYLDIYRRCGLEAIRVKATGGNFSKYSDEFQVVTDAGEDTIYLRADGQEAWNKELVSDENDAELLEYSGGTIRTARSVEVGNIFPLGTRYSEPMNAVVADESGTATPAWMGCYGIGISRLMGTIAEVHGNAESGKITWPESVAPFAVHVLDLLGDGQAEALYQRLKSSGVSVLFDDRDKTAGEKFADADLIGAPMRVVVSKRSMAAGGVELTRGGETKVVPADQV